VPLRQKTGAWLSAENNRFEAIPIPDPGIGHRAGWSKDVEIDARAKAADAQRFGLSSKGNIGPGRDTFASASASSMTLIHSASS
jgi:hypothetical protein